MKKSKILGRKLIDKKRTCEWCNKVCDNEEDLEKHRQGMHGRHFKEYHLAQEQTIMNQIYRKFYIKKEKIKHKKKGHIIKFGIELGNNVYDTSTWRENNPIFILDMSQLNDDEYPLNEESPNEFQRNSKYHVKCKNCGLYHSFSLNPYFIFNLKIKKREKISEEAIPLVLCTNCGLNVFVDNRKRMQDWLEIGNKLSKEMRLDIIMSYKPKERLKLRDIGGVNDCQ